jgi:glycosyltransferase involved in cell wall biosynthesis
MNMREQPLVSVVTPVYNGEKYLQECIESVLAQSYSNWEYTIVNNCSSDRTLDIAERYARKDMRIHVYSNDMVLPIIANHNRAFRLISPHSKYCKVVSADDWLFPECIMQMVCLADANPSIGIVGSYQLSGGGDRWYIRFVGLPYYSSVIAGRDISRAHLISELSVFGAPTSNLYRADLIRDKEAFFPNSTAEADVSACFECLKAADFGFVHQVLSYERLHDDRITIKSEGLNAYLSSKIGDLLTYGPVYLAPNEQQIRLKQLMDQYYEFLAISAVNFYGRVFWSYHRTRLKELGYPMQPAKLIKAICLKLLDLVLNPKQTVERLRSRVSKPQRSRISFETEGETNL